MLYRMARRYIVDVDRVDNCLIVGAGNGGYLLMNEIIIIWLIHTM